MQISKIKKKNHHSLPKARANLSKGTGVDLNYYAYLNGSCDSQSPWSPVTIE